MAVTTIGLGMNTLGTEQAASALSRQSVSGQYQSHSPRGLHALVNSVKGLISVRRLEDNPVPVTSVPAASYQSGPVAPESIVAAFGTSLATTTASGTDTDLNTPGIQLPTTLAGTTLRINGVPAPIFFVSPNQINYQLPAGTVAGTATVEVTSGNIVSTGTVAVNSVVPSIFSADASGTGVPAALALRVKANGQQSTESIFSVNTSTNRIVARPIDLGPEGESVYLVLFLSGIRRAPDPNNDGNVNEFVRVIINGTELVPAYAGRQGDLIGLDQINVEVPRYLLGAAALDITVVVGGQTFSNRTTAELVAPAVSSLNWRALGLANRQIRSFATIGSSLYAATNEGVYVSADNGVNWNAVNTGIPASTRIFSLLNSGTTLYAGTENQGAYVSFNNGESWTAINSGLSGLNLTINNITAYGGRLYAATNGGVCVYNGTAWTALNTGLANLTTLNLFVDAANLYVGTQGGVFCFNLNGGTSWTAVNNGFPVANVQVNSLRTIGGVLYAATSGYGLCRYNGTSWVAIAGGLPSNGIVTSIVNDGSRLFISTTLGIYVSNDGGATWALLNNGLTATDLSALFVNAGAIFAGTNGGGVFGAPFFNGNRAPIAYASSVTTNEDVSRRIQLSGYDPDLSPITYSIISSPVKGALTGTAPNMIYSPNANANGFDSFTFRVNDGTNNSATATVQININPVNDAPTATAQSVSTNEDTARAITLAGADVDGGALTYTVLSNPTNGMLSGTVPNLTYTPNTNYNGLDSFTFKVSDGLVESAAATISITVNAINDAPVLTVPGAQAVNTGDPVSFSVSATDVDAGQTIALSATSLPNGATFNPSTGAFSWPTSAVGVYNVSFTATDNGSPALSDTKTVRITVSGNSPNGFWTYAGGTPTDTPTAMTAVIIDGTDFFVGSNTGVYRTSDNGTTFTTVNNGLGTATNIVGLSVIDTTIYAGTQSGLYRTTDKGANWSRVGTNGVQSGIISVVKVGTTLIAATRSVGTYYSTDGTTWTASGSGLFGSIRSLIVKGGKAFVGCDNGVFSSTDGINWTAMNNGIAQTGNSRAIASLAAKGDLLYALDNQGLKLSADDGRNWVLLNNSSGTIYTNLNTARLYPGGNGLFIYNGSFYYSPDGGLTLVLMNTGDIPLNNPAAVATSSVIYSAATNGSATNKPGLFYSPFPNITANRAPSISVSGTPGTTTGSPVSLALSATDPDAGQTVTLAAVALPGDATFNAATGAFTWTPNTPGAYAAVFSAKDNGTPALGDLKVVTITVTGPALVGNWSRAAALPSNLQATALAASGTNIFAGSSQGVFISADNGVTWAAVNTGLAASRVISALVAIGTNLYASTSDGLYTSSNNGTNWTKINTGISGTVVDVASNGTNLYATTANAVFISNDNGASWRQTQAINLINGRTIAAVGNTILVNGQNVGLMRSVDGGSNWQSVSLSQSFTVATSLAANGATFFAGASDGIYRSTNGGQAWTKLTAGLPANSGCYKLIVNSDQIFAIMNPSGSSVVIYFSSDNGATWRLMDAGTPPMENTGGNPTLAAANNFLYYSSTSAGVYKSPFPLSPTNTAPTLTVPAAQNATAGQNLVFNVSAADNDAGQTVTLSAANLPLGASFVASTGRFTWTPGIAGTYIVGFTVVDSGTPALSVTKTVTITVAPPASSPNGFWQLANSGLEGIGLNSIAASGANVYAGSSTGLYRSTNGGASWSKLSTTGLPTAAISVLGANGTKLYGYSNGEMYRSSDSGANWTKIQTGLPTFRNFDVMYIANGALFLGTSSSGTGIYRSTDDGANWTSVYTSSSGSARVSAFTSIGETIYAVVNNGVLRGVNNGSGWATAGTLSNVYAITANGAILFAGTSQGISRSTDNGTTWAAVNTGLPANPFTGRILASNNVIYAALNNNGIYYSLNNGGNWLAMDSGNAPTSASLLAMGDSIYTSNNNSVVYASVLPAITSNTIPTLNVPAAQNATTTQSLNFTVTASDTDSGQTVTLSAAGLPGGATFNASTGQFSWTPNAPGTVSVSFTATDSGTPALSNTKIVTINATGISPAGNWINISGGLPSVPQSIVALGNEIFVGTVQHGVYKTSNGGQTWIASNTGMGNIAVVALNEINGLLYASGNGLYTSNDGGASWTLINNGLAGQVSSVAQIGARLLASTNVGVYSSTNNGTSWSASSTGLPASQQARSLVVSGTEVFVVAGSTGVVYKSTDNGANWTAVNTGLPSGQSVNSLAVNGTTLYAATGAGVYSSTNSGTNWTVVGSGLPTTSNNALIVHVSGSNLFVGYFFGTRVFASTNGGANWSVMNVGENVTYVRGFAVAGSKVYCWATPDGFTTGIFVSPVPGT